MLRHDRDRHSAVVMCVLWRDGDFAGLPPDSRLRVAAPRAISPDVFWGSGRHVGPDANGFS